MGKCIIVVGQGRSGTSLVANILSSFGIFVENTITTDRFNEKGYWESKQLVQINDSILETFGGKWPSFYVMPDGWEKSSRMIPMQEQSIEFLKGMNEYDVWAIKDPRLSVTFPFWARILPRDRKIILCARNPISVSRSLNSVASLDLRSGSRLWFATNLSAIKNIANEETIIVTYEKLILNPEKEATRIAKFALDSEDVKPSSTLKTIVSSNLSHFNYTLDDLISSREICWESKLLYLLLLEFEIKSCALNDFGRSLDMGDISHWSKLSEDYLSLADEIKECRDKYDNLVKHPYVRIGVKIKSLLNRF